MKIYLVGGAVRDQLLGLPVHERDWVVVGAKPEDLIKQGYTQVGKDFPVFLHPTTKEEYALARTERKSAPGYTGFSVDANESVSLEEDLLRRDLTLNAIARDDEGNLIDPFNGAIDLTEKILRHVSEAFVEDPLRVLRVARFAARFHHLGFKVAPETLALMSEIASSGELDHLTPERVWLETKKALSTESPQEYFLVLRECGALRILFPEVDRLFGVPQRKDYHPEEDTGVHTMMVLSQAAKISSDIGVRFAALTHDLGKGETPESEWPSHFGHEKKSLRLVRDLSQRYRLPNDVRDIAERVAEFHTHGHRALELKPSMVLTLFERLDAFRKPERLEHFLLACLADSRGRTGYEDSEYPQAEYLREVARSCQRINAKRFAEQGMNGQQIGAALRRERLQHIAQVKQVFV